MALARLKRLPENARSSSGIGAPAIHGAMRVAWAAANVTPL